MKKVVKTWWLKTHDNVDVCADAKGHYSLEHLPGCAVVEFREGEHTDDDIEILGAEISEFLGVECHWVRGLDIYV